MNESYFKSHDHHRLYYQYAEPKKDTKAVLIFVHGLNEHSGRYQNPTQYFTKKGYAVYLFDHRGHGKSDGLRSYVDNFEHYIKDIHEFVQFVAKENKGTGLFIVGHSLGGQMVANYVAQYPEKLSGFVISSANIETAVPISALKKYLGNKLASYLPRFKLKNEIDPYLISRDEGVVKAYVADPLVSKHITLKLASEILTNQESIYEKAAQITLPALILHGDKDKICACEGSEKFAEKLKSNDKKLVIYKGAYHELFNELDKEKAFQEMERFFEAHLSRAHASDAKRDKNRDK
ncbi:lysophospholipase [bacterium]|nr:lysophospholipase [bacterium]